LLVGAAAGHFVDGRPEWPFTARSVKARLAAAGRSSEVRRPPSDVLRESHGSDEAFLVELDARALTPHIEPLRALDAMTPRMGEVIGAGR
jgi:hypothetical protein